jgi:tetratricopeptide (TPR) repeat protein
MAYWLWASFIGFYVVAVAVFYVSARHRLPLLVPLCITAGMAVDALAASWEARLRPGRRGYAVAILLAALAVVSNWPFALDDGRSEERTRMALWLVGQGRYDEAESRIAAIERGHPHPGMLHFRVGRAFMVRDQADAAIRHLEVARKVDPGRPETSFALGQALLAGRRPKEAIPHLRHSLEVGSPAGRGLPAGVESGVPRDIAGFDLTRAHAAAGDRAGAVKVLQTVRPARADDGESWRALGQLAMELQAPRLAEAFLRQAIRVEPSSAKGYEQLGLAVALSGRFEEAIGVFEQAVRLDGRDARARLNLAVSLAEVGRADDARRHAAEALRLDPSYEKARQFLAAIEQKTAKGARKK